MKRNTIAKKLGHFRTFDDKTGAMIYQSRANLNRIVRVIGQDHGNAFALPIIVESDGSERVAFHPTTVKSLVEFLEGAA